MYFLLGIFKVFKLRVRERRCPVGGQQADRASRATCRIQSSWLSLQWLPVIQPSKFNILKIVTSTEKLRGLGIVLSTLCVLTHLILTIASAGDIIIILSLQMRQLRNKKLSKMPKVMQLVTESAIQTPEHTLSFHVAASFCAVVFHLTNDVSFCKGGSC